MVQVPNFLSENNSSVNGTKYLSYISFRSSIKRSFTVKILEIPFGFLALLWFVRAFSCHSPECNGQESWITFRCHWSRHTLIVFLRMYLVTFSCLGSVLHVYVPVDHKLSLLLSYVALFPFSKVIYPNVVDLWVCTFLLETKFVVWYVFLIECLNFHFGFDVLSMFFCPLFRH